MVRLNPGSALNFLFSMGALSNQNCAEQRNNFWQVTIWSCSGWWGDGVLTARNRKRNEDVTSDSCHAPAR